VVLAVLGVFMLTACARTVKERSLERSSVLWDFRVGVPSDPWEEGLGVSPFVQRGTSVLTDMAYHNPFTGGAIFLRVRPLWFRYGDFNIEDHARGAYRAFVEIEGNDLRVYKDGHFVPLEEGWQTKDVAGQYQRIEIPLRGSISRFEVDEEDEERRVEEEIEEAEEEEDKFGPEDRIEVQRGRNELRRTLPRITQDTLAKIVIILRRAAPSDLLYAFYFVGHELASPQDLEAFDRFVESFEISRK
jgi:hypothetical protein